MLAGEVAAPDQVPDDHGPGRLARGQGVSVATSRCSWRCGTWRGLPEESGGLSAPAHPHSLDGYQPGQGCTMDTDCMAVRERMAHPPLSPSHQGILTGHLSWATSKNNSKINKINIFNIIAGASEPHHGQPGRQPLAPSATGAPFWSWTTSPSTAWCWKGAARPRKGDHG
jgi:hypothetical protein